MVSGGGPNVSPRWINPILNHSARDNLASLRQFLGTSASAIANVAIIGLIPVPDRECEHLGGSLTDPVWPPTIDFSPPIRPTLRT
jgi:hypothetical protein